MTDPRGICTVSSGPTMALVHLLNTTGSGAPHAPGHSENRNFEGRIHPQTEMNFLASPLLVVAYALARTMWANMLK